MPMREDPMRQDADWAALARYLAGESSAGEKEEVEAWLEEALERRAFVERLRRIWKSSEEPRGQDLPDREMEADRRRLLQAVRKQRQETRAPAQARAPSRRARRKGRGPMRRLFAGSASPMMRVALLLILLVGGVFLAEQFYGGVEEEASEPLFREITTRRGERATVTFSDGSVMTLSVDSRLRLPETFGRGETREVRLEGEAYFEVAADADRPFFVRTGSAVVRVTGTAFGVTAYPDGGGTQVVVKEGSVELRPGHEQTPEARASLTAGQLGHVPADTGRVTTRAVDPGDYLSWTDGRLAFVNAPLPEVVTRLERWYGVGGQLEGERLRSLRLTASLDSRSVPHVLDVITTTLGISYRMRSDSTFVLTGKS